MFGNPLNDYYMRNAQAQMNPQFNQPPYQLPLPFPPQQPQVPQIHCNWVSGVEEAKAAQMDFVATNIYLDTSTGKIYLKRMSDNGKPQFLTYVIENDVPDTKDPLSEINARLSNIENFLGGLRNESISGNANVQQSTTAFNSAVAEPHEFHDEAKSTGVSKDAGNGWRKK